MALDDHSRKDTAQGDGMPSAGALVPRNIQRPSASVSPVLSEWAQSETPSRNVDSKSKECAEML